MTQEREEMLMALITKSPLALLTLKAEEDIKFVNNLLPYSIGFEIECFQGRGFKESDFKMIPNIMAVSIDSGEQRFRIPNGIEGMICLWHISETLKVNSLLNYGSGIHYHVDMTRNYRLLDRKIMMQNEEWMLEDLDSWNYEGTYNIRGCSNLITGSWFRYQPDFKTCEFRVGSMTFEYHELLDKMIKASIIITKLVNIIGGQHALIDSKPVLNSDKLLNFVSAPRKHNNDLIALEVGDLRKQLLELKSEGCDKEEEDIEAIMRNRIIRK